MINVTQLGNTNTPPRVRNFVYDSFGRLTSASNPESGTVLYGYDANGNVLAKTTPTPGEKLGTQTPTVIINYSYDALNRLTQKSYNGTVLQYGYDGTGLSGCGAEPPGIASPTNLIGHRSSMCSGMSASSWSYDSMGRPLVESRTNLGTTTTRCTGAGKYRACINSDAYAFRVGYTYNLDGSLNTLTYPSGDVVTYTVGGAGRVLRVSDSANNYVGYSGNSATYTPNGALASMVNGQTGSFAGIATSNAYNDRLQPILLSAGVLGQSSILRSLLRFPSWRCDRRHGPLPRHQCVCGQDRGSMVLTTVTFSRSPIKLTRSARLHSA